MALDNLIGQYRHKASLMGTAGNDGKGHEFVDSIGRECDELLKAIIAFEATAPDEARDKFLFLLDHLEERCELPEHGAVFHALRDHFVRLV